MIDAFAGCEGITKAARRRGFHACSLEIKDGPGRRPPLPEHHVESLAGKTIEYFPVDPLLILGASQEFLDHYAK